jgi:hypothetical protein
MHILVATRFSIFDEKRPKGWVLTRTAADADAYRRALFDEKRLSVKFACFERLTLPGMLAQKPGAGNALRWLIFAGAEMPQRFRERLLRGVAGLHWVRVVWVDSLAHFRKDLGAEVEGLRASGVDFATVRLDDDDAIAARYCATLAKCGAQRHDVVCFTRGRHVQVDVAKDGRIAWFSLGGQVRVANNAFGMAMIGEDIYRAGNHNQVAKHHRVREIDAPDMWLATCSSFCDTKRQARPGTVGPRVAVSLERSAGPRGKGDGAATSSGAGRGSSEQAGAELAKAESPRAASTCLALVGPTHPPSPSAQQLTQPPPAPQEPPAASDPAARAERERTEGNMGDGLLERAARLDELARKELARRVGPEVVGFLEGTGRQAPAAASRASEAGSTLRKGLHMQARPWPGSTLRPFRRPATARPATPKPAAARPATPKPAAARPATPKPAVARPAAPKPAAVRSGTHLARRAQQPKPVLSGELLHLLRQLRFRHRGPARR